MQLHPVKIPQPPPTVRLLGGLLKGFCILTFPEQRLTLKVNTRVTQRNLMLINLMLNLMLMCASVSCAPVSLVAAAAVAAAPWPWGSKVRGSKVREIVQIFREAYGSPNYVMKAKQEPFDNGGGNVIDLT
jgi:hypothetical protein